MSEKKTILTRAGELSKFDKLFLEQNVRRKNLSENKLYQPELVSCLSVDLDPLLFCQQTNHRSGLVLHSHENVDQQNTHRMWTKLILGLVRFPAPPLLSQSGNLTNAGQAGGHNICFVTRHCYIVRCALLHCYIVHCNTLLHCYIISTCIETLYNAMVLHCAI